MKLAPPLLLALLATASPAAAIPVMVVDFDTVVLGAPESPLVNDLFTVALPPPLTMGTLATQVFDLNGDFAYVSTVVPTQDENGLFNTQFNVRGFTGVAGWSFADTAAAGGAGSATDFIPFHSNLTGRLNFITNLNGPGAGWNPGEAITFFFVSTKPPGMGDYNLISDEAGSATTLAPVPEPGTMALFGSGVAWLYARHRRRKTAL